MIAWFLLHACRAPTGPDVVLITLDTTRRDRLGVYGHIDARTPALDALAARGRRYTRATSPVPLTIPAHASLFTGRYPPRLGIRANGDAVLPPAATTLAERLSDAGWHTAASVGAFVTSRTWGFDQGFSAFYAPTPTATDPWRGERPGAEVVDDIVAWAQQTASDPRPRFVWVHLFDPHHPRTPDPAGGDPYDAEIAAVDRAVARLVATFDRRQTVFVVVGDHGESLGEHGEARHGWWTYEATAAVPWILTGPSVAAGEVVDEPVSLVDVAPTVLDLLEVRALPETDGIVVPSGDPDRALYIESWQLTQRFGLTAPRAVVQGRLKLIDLPRPELYDVVADPAETTDLAGTRSDDVARLQQILAGWNVPPPTADPAHPPDRDLAARLAALGYVDPVGAMPAAPLPDPKDHTALLAAIQRIEGAIESGRWAVAEAQLAALARRYPHITEIAMRRGSVLERLGRPDAARAEIGRAADQDQDDAGLQVALATHLAVGGHFADAAARYEAAARVLPWSPAVRRMALLAWLDAGQPARVVDLGTTWRGAHPDDEGVAGLLGIGLIRQGRIAEAIPLLEEGVRADAPARGVLFHLSAVASGRRDPATAAALLEREIVLHPGYPPAVAALSRLQRAGGQLDDAMSTTAGALAVRPADPFLLVLHGEALLATGDRQGARRALEAARGTPAGSEFGGALEAALSQDDSPGLR